MSGPWAPHVLVGCSHGTRDVAGRRTVADLLLAVRAARPDLPVRAAFVDVQPPAVADLVGRLVAAGSVPVVVPLLLSGGYHVRVDVAAAVAASPGAVAATALGPDDALAAVLVDRLAAAGVAPGDAVVLAAAGSSDPRAAADVEVAVALLARRRPGPVTAGYGSVAAPSVPEAVDAARAGGAGRVAVASYLLAPGHFHSRLAQAGADVVTAPIGVDERVVDLVLRRFDEAVAAAGAPLVPDTKDWTWVLERPCPECGFSSPAGTGPQVVPRVRANVAAWRGRLAEVPADAARRRPRPGTWSLLEYACHVRDAYRIFTERLVLMLTRDDAAFANWDQDATAVERDYAGQDPAAVAGELADAGLAFADALAAVAGRQWERRGRRSNGSRFTVDSLARYLLHDVEHHLHDVGR